MKLFLIAIAYVSAMGEEGANPIPDSKDRKVVVTVTETEVAYNHIFGGFEQLYGPLQHLQWNTIPK